MNRQRFYAVIDIDTADAAAPLEKGDVAILLHRPTVDPTVYASLEDMIADRDDKAGAFEPPAV